MGPTEGRIWATVQAMNRCWTCGDLSELDRLNDYFHDTMVAITPTDKHRLEGRETCVAAWKAFARNANVHYWKESDPKVQVYGNAAVVTYYYDMSFDMGGRTITTGGRDMFTLIHKDGKWWIVADHFSPYPPQ